MKIFLPILFILFFLFSSSVNSGEAPKLHEWQRIQGEVTEIRLVYIVGQGNVYVIVVKKDDGKEETFMYFQKPNFQKGQRVQFKDNKIEILK